MPTLADDLAEIDRAIASFDGSHVAPLRDTASAIAPTKTIIGHLINRSNERDDPTQTATSWLIKHYLEQGADLTSTHNADIVGLAVKLGPWQARLHFAQSFAWLTIPNNQAATVAKILGDWFASEHKFLRAWACDALWRLGRQHQQFRQMALDIVLQAEADPAASVRARARNLLKLK
ncbi:MAG: hypothetical protein AAF414_00935 [Pseudomonadota bacterium]